jgi:AcrR family transcriptional regulator
MAVETVFRTPTRDDLLAAARRRFFRGEKLELAALAEELGISRATAYRWAGNADQLVGEVIADLAEQTFHMTWSEAKGKGAAKIIASMTRGMRYIIGSEPYRRFLERDPASGLRIAASKDGPSQGRMIALHQQILEEEIAKGNLTLTVDTHTMAYALVRIAETFIYADLIAGEKPDIDKAREILKLLLS